MATKQRRTRRWRARVSVLEGVLWAASIPPTFLLMPESLLLKWVALVSLWTAARTAFSGAQADMD